ncbi:lectin subunit alpha-like [Lucilia cuprina]|uniref:lectin subunit alpha-like n=1 Tax=Lucilia cuprina TaxID=7375 RepID=UPI001F054BEE|nr:lectin subunit alpha-like [Lucilia cuprina]
MKITQVFIICFALLEAVSTTQQLYKASDGSDYLIETELKYNWYQAWHECARRNYQLVEIESAAKNNAIIDLLKKVIGKSHNLWLGGNDEYSTNRDYARPFFWSATGQQFTFTFWSNNNPDNYRNNEHCVHIWQEKSMFEWNDNDCTVKMGFICEPNHLVQKYRKDLQDNCDALKQSNLLISTEFDEIQKQQLSLMDNKLQNIDRVGNEWNLEMQRLQNSTQAAVQKLLDDQQVMLKQLTEKMLKQVNDLNTELKNSNEQINTQFSKKLNEKQNEINKFC